MISHIRVVQGFFFGISLLVFAVHAVAGKIPYDECFTAAADRYNINKQVLVAIAKTESGLNPNAIGPRNANGTYDIGIMQINSSWLPSLAKFGIDKRELMNVCTNIYVGSWILAGNIGIHGPVWRAVGAYNASTASRQVSYVSRVQRNYLLLTASDNG